jgi:hypothetical protein
MTKWSSIGSVESEHWGRSTPTYTSVTDAGRTVPVGSGIDMATTNSLLTRTAVGRLGFTS